MLACRAISLTIQAGAIALIIGAYMTGPYGGSPFLLGQGQGEADAKDIELNYQVLAAVLVGSTVLGVLATTFSVVLLDLFHRYGNSADSWWSKLLARDAYAAYIIHSHTVTLLAMSYVAILGLDLSFDGKGNTSTTSFGNHDVGKIAGGWVYTSFLGVVVTWAVADAIRRLPGVRDIV